jgi:murein hydrolase activator
MARTAPRRVGCLALSLACAAAAHPAAAQQPDTLRQRIRDSQLRLQEIRQERDKLQQQMDRLQSRVRDASGELDNIQKQVAVSNQALAELNFQAGAVAASISGVTSQLLRTRDLLRARSAILRARLRAIYERGPLRTVEALLGARSFADLLNRYKYLHVIAVHDRALVNDVARLEGDFAAQQQKLQQQMDQLESVRQQRVRETDRLQGLQSRYQRTLEGYRGQQRQTEARLGQLQRDASELTNLVATLERRRREEESRRAAAGQPAESGSLTTRELGALRWPVDGQLVYRFGPERKPNGVVLRWNGIGIGAPVGTPVRAVEDGTVVLAGPFEGYGPSVMLSHGGGYYSLYLYLDAVAVKVGQHVQTGEIVGTVGGQKTPEGPHIEFQIRAPVNGAPVAVDPLEWLRARSGS